ncbi:hypothetical protein NPIL_580541 [Nephila pilipes]|uniref:Uncharacterized protein n=1 Tax=Nephila pilipes TaxID=299642 RepID=A0A8X6THI9_NEPPI|nr:hypothetical protein NPIL_580541 [Nephila pilipes]
MAEIAAFLGTCVWNDEQNSMVSVAKKLDWLIDKKMKMHFQNLDKLRIRETEKHPPTTSANDTLATNQYRTEQ